MKKVEEIVLKLSEPVVAELGLEVWDIEYVKEGGEAVLRLYIDGPGEISIDQCEAVSRKLDKLLDEADPVPGSYIFEVSSAGIERRLRRPSDFERYIGSKIEIKLYKPIHGGREHVGRLVSYNNGDVTIEAAENMLAFLKKDIANVRLRAEF